MNPVEAGLARVLIGFREVSFLAAGGGWDELRLLARQGWPEWRYRLFQAGVKVTASPHGSGWVSWSLLRAIVPAGLSAERARRVNALARIDWTDPRHLPERLERAGLPADAEPAEIRAAKDAIAAEVVEAGIVATSGVQLELFSDGGAA